MQAIAMRDNGVNNNRSNDAPLFHFYSICLTDVQIMIQPSMTTTGAKLRAEIKDTPTLRAAELLLLIS